MRQSVLLSKLLLNTEVWIRVTKHQIDTLEQIDISYLRKLLNCHSKINVEIIHGECATVPIRFLIIMRRLMYYWHILQRDDSELINRIYRTQKVKRQKSDWINLTEEDKRQLDIQLSDEDIKCVSKDKFRGYLKKRIGQLRKQFLQNLQLTHTKSKYLDMSENPSEYLSDIRFTKKQVEILLALRSRTIWVKENFKNMYTSDNMLCFCCKLFTCTQQHIMVCPKIVQKSQILHIQTNNLTYDMIYGDTDQQLKITIVFEKLLKIREEIIAEEAVHRRDGSQDTRS